jgi:hypothetical protein
LLLDRQMLALRPTSGPAAWYFPSARFRQRGRSRSLQRDSSSGSYLRAIVTLKSPKELKYVGGVKGWYYESLVWLETVGEEIGVGLIAAHIEDSCETRCIASTRRLPIGLSDSRRLGALAAFVHLTVFVTAH